MKTLIKSLIATSLVVGSLSALEAKDTRSFTITVDAKTITALKDIGFVYNPTVAPKVTPDMLKRSYYSASSTHPAGQAQACRDSFGEDARIANWEDIENMVDNGGDITSFVDDVLFGSIAEKLFINVDGNDHNSDGKYIIRKGHKFFSSSAIDDIAKHQLDLIASTNYSDFQDTLCYVPESEWVTNIVIR